MRHQGEQPLKPRPDIKKTVVHPRTLLPVHHPADIPTTTNEIHVVFFQDYLSTPLHVAADAGYVDICRRLLEEDIDPDACDVVRFFIISLSFRLCLGVSSQEIEKVFRI